LTEMETIHFIAEKIDRLNELSGMDDPEKAHSEADKILCEVISNLGYYGVAEAYNKIERWYS